MKLLSDNRLIAWGTVLSAVVTAVSMAVTVIVYEVRTADGVAHCVQAIDGLGGRVDAISGVVGQLREDVGYLRGRCEPHKVADADKASP